MKRRTKIILGIFAALIIMGGAFAFFAWRYLNEATDKEVTLILPDGTTRQALADSLNARLGDDLGPKVYKIYCAKADEDATISGYFEFSAGTSAKDIARALLGKRQTPVHVVFNEVRTMPQLAQRIASQMDFTPQEFLSACDSILPAAGFAGPEEYPAAFIPDKYEFYWTASPVVVVRKLLEARNQFWNDERRTRAGAKGLTPVKVATVASIAEEETNNADERALVARLYLNRLAKNMPLQADPTIKFALDDFAIRRITGVHLKVESPYNTYTNQGLPPGPIRIPEKSTLLSVLNAPEHDFIYMCARPDSSGLHNFAKTLAEHNANAKAYWRWLDSRGIK